MSTKENKKKDKKKDKKEEGALVLLSMLVGLVMGLMLNTGGEAPEGESSKFDRALYLIGRHYVDPIDCDTLGDRTIALLAASLDPHSRYASAEEMRSEEPALQGNLEGIGITLFSQGDTFCAYHVLPDSPAEQVGMLPGDRLLRADTVSLLGLSSDEVIGHLRGRRRSAVELTIKRPGEEGQRHLRVVRDKVPTPSVLYAGMLDSRRGYIVLQRFCETSHQEFRQALTSLKEQGMKHLILDLRDNSGGLLTAALKIADELLPANQLILYSEGAHQRRHSYYSHPDGLWTEGQLTVMVDEYSASAAEIIAGTVQDNDRGLIVGRRTFGKGLVQTQYPFKDGSYLILSTARYHTPSGRCIQRPYDKGTDEYYRDYLRQLAFEHVGDSSLLRPTDTTRYFTTSGRVVYAGGGILPDRPLKLFTDSLLAYYNDLVNRDLFRRVAFNFISGQAAQLREKYPTPETFERHFHTPQALLDDLVERGASLGIKPNPRTLNRYGTAMRQRIKACIGECLYTPEYRYRIMLPYDNDLQNVLKMK